MAGVVTIPVIAVLAKRAHPELAPQLLLRCVMVGIVVWLSVSVLVLLTTR